jgi:hypothetical protein
MTEDEKREFLKNTGLPPHIVNEVFRRDYENKAHAGEVYLYVKEIMGLGDSEAAHTLFTAFWMAMRDELKGLGSEQISLMLSLVSMSFSSNLKSLMDEAGVSGDPK